jgi:D-glycero-alpha-D-manno-heptose 1-phosphate guanylyltransferase
MNKMDAIILAGGMGTRLRKVVPDVPKPLATVNNRPFLDILLKQLDSSACINKVVMAVGYKSGMIIDRYANSTDYNIEILFSIEKKLLGTGGAIKQAVSLTGSRDVLVLNGDSFIGIDLNDFIAFHKKKEAILTIALKQVIHAGRFGRVEMDKNNRIVFFKEKTDDKNPGLINAGMYILKRNVFDGIKEGAVLSMERDFFPALTGPRMLGYVAKGGFIDIGIPETYKLADKYFKGIGGMQKK